LTGIPVAVGFGVSTPDQVREIAGCSDGVIVGSSIVRRIGERGEIPGFEREVGEYVEGLTEALR
jgi:tryptophan synthase alpha chain